jgi:membrane fusion protein (multidrug efflux system)
MTKKRIIWTIIIIAGVGLLAWPKLSTDKSKNIQAGKGASKNMPVKVSLYIASKQDVEHSIQVTGNVLADEAVDLVSETQGRILGIHFKEGSEVTKGQLLLKINDADLRAQLARATASQKLKQETEQRARQLLEKQAISQEAYDMSLTDLNTSIADVDLLKEQIRKTEIKAPFSGYIGLRYVSEGGYVSNATKIASLQSLGRVKVEFSVPEKYAPRLKNGDEIQFTVDGQAKTFTAKIFAIEPKVDPVTRNVAMRATCDNSSRLLIPGAFARVNVILPNNNQSVMIPTQAVVPILKGQKVFIKQGDTAVERIIKTGVRTDKLIEVKDGLNVGDSVIVGGVMYIKQGSKVKAGK